MNMFIYKIAIIFIPGIIARILLDRLLFYKHKDNFYFLIHSFLLGICSYIILFLIQSLLNSLCSKNDVFDIVALLLNPESNADVGIKIILYASIITIPMSFFISFVEKNKYITKIFMKSRATSRFSEPDVWSYLFNSDQFYKNSWVNIRDKKHNIVYQGAVAAFSDTSSEPELLLTDVIVYSNVGDESRELYSVKALYLSLTKSDIEIECLF